jgi:site-specific DNA-cytosine methylase
MKLCLDLCSGLGGFSQAFKDAPGWEVVTVDIDRSFKPVVQADASRLPFRDGLQPDVILASPPCEKFSVESVSRYWKRGRPGPEAERAGKLVRGILSEIERLQPVSWILENPDGMLKRIIGRPRWVITLCKYGARHQKRTALWGTVERFRAKKCHNGDPCHEPAPRGSRSGVQGLSSSAVRARMPLGLSKAVLDAVEGGA